MNPTKKLLIALGLAFAATGCVSTQEAPAPKQADETRASHGDAPPFARVALALKGCSSCATCRSTIRQTTKSNAEEGKVRVGSDSVEVVYSEPQKLPLQQIIHGLSANGLHDLSVLDVLFDAEGTVCKKDDGQLFFSLRETKQSFLLTIPPYTEPPPTQTPLRLRAVVQGWEKEGTLSLAFKYVL